MVGVALVAGLAAVVVALSGASALLVDRARVQAAADATALAGADAAAGLRAGAPCVVAASAAGIGGVRLDACVVDGSSVTVRVASIASAVSVTALATAGPPPP